MSRPARGRVQESDLPADVRARLAARRDESETPEFRRSHAREVARLQQEFPPLRPDPQLLETFEAEKGTEAEKKREKGPAEKGAF